MRRREFIARLSGTMGMLSLGSQAQQGERLRRIGWLDPAPDLQELAVFRTCRISRA